MIQYFPIVTGSLTVLGNINVSGSITTSGSITISGSITSASFASTASYWSGSITNASSASFASTASFVANAQTASYVLNAVSSSFASTASFVALAQSASNAVSAVTASFANNLTVAGTLTAQTLVVSTINVTQSFSSGSNIFGNALTNTQVFSGSVSMNPGGLFVSGSGLVGIGTTSPSSKLHVVGSSLTDTFRITDASNYTIVMGYSGSANVGMISTLGGTAKLALGTNSAARLTIDGNGLVGIGTSTPTYKFEVAGTTGTFSFNPNQASTMVIRGSVTGNFDINNEGASGVMRLYGTSIQLRTAALDPAVTITAAGGLQTNLSTISSYYNTPGNVASGGTTTFVYNQTSAEYTVGFEYCIVSLYAPSGTNLYGVAHGFVFFMADGATSASYISQTIANGWTVTHSATNAGVFTVTFTAGGGATHSNINIRTRKINRTNAG
jgi:hypothetical protein